MLEASIAAFLAAGFTLLLQRIPRWIKGNPRPLCAEPHTENYILPCGCNTWCKGNCEYTLANPWDV